MNINFAKLKRTAAAVTAFVLTAAVITPVAYADDGDLSYAEKTVYRSSDAWPSDDELTVENLNNDDPVWTFAYQNNSTGGQYVAYTNAYAAGESCEGYVKPEADNYLNDNASGKAAPVYSDISTNSFPGRRNAMGKYWMRLSTTTGAPAQSKANRIAKIFTAPKSGDISITARDIAGDSKIYNKRPNADNPGALLRVKKLSADGTATELWKYEFKNTSSDLLLSADCGNTSTFINKGEQLIFEVSAENDASGWHKQVFWDPVVIYNYEPESIEPSDLTAVPLEQKFTVNFAEETDTLTMDNMSVSGEGTPTVSDFSQSDDMKSISFSFDGLKGDTTYSVTVSGIKLGGDTTELTTVFSFTTEHVFEYPVYNADDAWKSGSNSDSVWKWLYRDNQTAKETVQYAEYKIFGTGNVDGLGMPSKDADGKYDYAADTTDRIGVFADSNANHGMRNAMGRYWMRPSVAGSSEPKQSTENRIVKQFSAPESGKIVISAADLNGEAKIYNKGLAVDGNKLTGARVIITRRSADGEELENIFQHDFIYTSDDCPSDGLGVYDFEDIECDISAGEKLWFEVSAEQGGSAYAKQVSWNPVIDYKAVYPNITECEPKDGAVGVAPNFVHQIRFDREIKDIDSSSIIVDGARCGSAWLEDGNTLLCIKYDGLEANTQYTVTINDVCMSGTNDGIYRPIELKFATGDMVQFGEISLDGELKAGANTVSVNINNAAGSKKPYAAALLAVVCQKTEKGYTAVSTRAVYDDKIAENSSLSVSVQVPDTDNYFIKAVLLETLPSARAVLPIKSFSK